MSKKDAVYILCIGWGLTSSTLRFSANYFAHKRKHINIGIIDIIIIRGVDRVDNFKNQSLLDCLIANL